MMSMSRPGRRALALVASISPSRLYVRSGMGLYHLHATIPYRRALAATALLLSLILPRSESSETVLPRYRASRLHETLEPAIDHALGVERQRLCVHHAGQPLVGHHPGVDAIALPARLVGDPGKHHGFARLELDAARERGALADLDVVGNPFPVFQRAVLTPDLAGLLRHAAIGGKVFPWDRDDKSIDIRHRHYSRCASTSHPIMDYVWQQAAVPGSAHTGRAAAASPSDTASPPHGGRAASGRDNGRRHSSCRGRARSRNRCGRCGPHRRDKTR